MPRHGCQGQLISSESPQQARVAELLRDYTAKLGLECLGPECGGGICTRLTLREGDIWNEVVPCKRLQLRWSQMPGFDWIR